MTKPPPSLKKLLATTPEKKKKSRNEGKFWGDLRVAANRADGWRFRRVETKFKDGFPDCVAKDPNQRIHFVELKHTVSSTVALSPLQVSFHNQFRAGLTWILVKSDNAPDDKYYLYHGASVIDLALDGLKTPPYALTAGKLGLSDILAAMENAKHVDINTTHYTDEDYGPSAGDSWNSRRTGKAGQI